MKALQTTLFSMALAYAMAGCNGSNNDGMAQTEQVSPADTIYLGDLREKFKHDSLFFKHVAPDLILVQNQYTWVTTEDIAIRKGLSKTYFNHVRQEIDKTNEAIRTGLRKGAKAERIPDFQKDLPD